MDLPINKFCQSMNGKTVKQRWITGSASRFNLIFLYLVRRLHFPRSLLLVLLFPKRYTLIVLVGHISKNTQIAFHLLLLLLLRLQRRFGTWQKLKFRSGQIAVYMGRVAAFFEVGQLQHHLELLSDHVYEFGRIQIIELLHDWFLSEQFQRFIDLLDLV